VKIGFTLALLILLLGQLAAQPEKACTVKIDNPENGRIELDPPIPPEGKVPAGTVITVKAAPDPGYAFDSGYYAAPGVWGKMYYESMAPVFQVTIDKDKSIGALSRNSEYRFVLKGETH
jgi:acetyl esterase